MTFDLGHLHLKRGAPPLVIAEIGVNFNGDLELAKRSIDMAVGAGAGAVKFQTFRAEEFIADPQLTYTYTSQGKEVTEQAVAMFKRLELKTEWHKELSDYAAARGSLFLSSAADPISADLLKKVGVPALKIASEDLINVPLLRHVAGLSMPVILSTGMADEWEVDRAVEILSPCPSLLLMHCTSLYPTPPQEANLARMTSLALRYGLPVGYSDHTMGSDAAAAATALGALMIEKHFTIDKTLPGPDHAMSADPRELAELSERARRISAMIGSQEIAPSPGERIARQDFRRSIVAARKLKAGALLALGDMAVKRPHTGLHPFEMDSLVGKTLKQDLDADQQITRDMVN